MSTKIVIKTTDRVVPMIYAYTTPEIARHNGWTKIGYTEQDVDKRLSQQTHTADVEYKEEWRGNATFEDGSGDTFTDKDFHRYLRKLNIENDPKNELKFSKKSPASRWSSSVSCAMAVITRIPPQAKRSTLTGSCMMKSCLTIPSKSSCG